MRRALLILSILVFPSLLAAQSAVDSVALLREQLDQKRTERAGMERMLSALNSVDSVYKMHYPTWVVLDEDLRERVNRAFRMRVPNTPRDGEVTVVANPEANEIVELRVGDVRMGRRETHVNLSDSLHTELLSGDYPRQIIDAAPIKPRTNTLFGVRPRFAALSASAFGATLLMSDGRGVEVKLGHEEIGYHFWSTGDMRVMAILDRFKIGIIVPVTFGKPKQGIVRPLDIRPRLMTGSRGMSAEYEHPLDNAAVGARFSVGEQNVVTMPDLFVSMTELYYLHTVAQLYYTRNVEMGDNEHRFGFTLGAGFHQIAQGKPDLNSGRISADAKHDFASPILRVDYSHRGPMLYGGTVQFYNSILFTKAWVEIIRDFLFLDLAYYSPIVRDPKPWEQPYFFMVSPRIQVIY